MIGTVAERGVRGAGRPAPAASPPKGVQHQLCGYPVGFFPRLWCWSACHGHHHLKWRPGQMPGLARRGWLSRQPSLHPRPLGRHLVECVWEALGLGVSILGAGVGIWASSLEGWAARAPRAAASVGRRSRAGGGGGEPGSASASAQCERGRDGALPAALTAQPCSVTGWPVASLNGWRNGRRRSVGGLMSGVTVPSVGWGLTASIAVRKALGGDGRGSWAGTVGDGGAVGVDGMASRAATRDRVGTRRAGGGTAQRGARGGATGCGPRRPAVRCPAAGAGQRQQRRSSSRWTSGARRVGADDSRPAAGSGGGGGLWTWGAGGVDGDGGRRAGPWGSA